MKTTEFARRRRQLMRMMDSDSIAILPTSPERVRNRDVVYPYRADSDFHYLTGFPEPEAVAVLVPGRDHGEYILFCRERDAEMETWHGRRAGLEGACELYGADDAFPISDIDEILPGLLENRERVFYTMGCNAAFDKQLMDWLNQIRAMSRSGVNPPGEFVSLDHLLHDLRLFKSRAEVSQIRKAIKASVVAHKRAMQICRPGVHEYELEAELIHQFTVNGACSTAYPPIVGGGANGCILHYTENSDPLRDGDLVLIDAGGEVDCYASDITRTFPVNGSYSPAQKALYDVVLEAQLAAIAKMKPGNHWNEPHEAAVKVLTKGLIKLGLIKGSLARSIKDEAYKPFYMHRTGHWLGLDVHDVGDYKVNGEWRALEPGMVMTVEPGLYVAKGSKGVSRKWWDIGIRIEDDILITRDGNEVLSRALPKTTDEIEALMAR